MSLVDLGKRLLEAAKQGDTEEVRQLMTNGAPFTTDWLGTSPLHMAAQYGFLETAEVLLRAGISRDARTKVDRTPLHIASQEGHIEIVELLLKHGADIEAKDMLKMTSLHWAVERGHLDIIACLLKYGADPAANSKFFKTPADIAMDNCRHDLVEMLSENVESMVKIAENNSHQNVQLTISNPNRTGNVKTAIPKITNIQTAKSYGKKHIPVNRNTVKPIILQSTNMQRTLTMTDNIEKVLPIADEMDSDSSSTSVLATLAALAEATASNNTTLSNNDTLQWLESHGITMLPSDNSTIVTSAVEGGQTISLTEAGKLALNWVKDNPANNKSQETKRVISTMPVTKSGLNPRIYTIVADQGQLVATGQNSNVMLVSRAAPADNSGNNQQDNKSEIVRQVENSGDEKTSEENEKEKLRGELEAMKKQAEEYRTQLQLKEHEAEQYKKQLEQMQGGSNKKT